MSDRDEIEFAEPAFYDCACCGHRATFDLSDQIVECDQPIVDYVNSRIRGD